MANLIPFLLYALMASLSLSVPVSPRKINYHRTPRTLIPNCSSYQLWTQRKRDTCAGWLAADEGNRNAGNERIFTWVELIWRNIMSQSAAPQNWLCQVFWETVLKSFLSLLLLPQESRRRRSWCSFNVHKQDSCIFNCPSACAWFIEEEKKKLKVVCHRRTEYELPSMLILVRSTEEIDSPMTLQMAIIRFTFANWTYLLYIPNDYCVLQPPPPPHLMQITLATREERK